MEITERIPKITTILRTRQWGVAALLIVTVSVIATVLVWTIQSSSVSEASDSATAPSSGGLLGDANGDGVVDDLDASLILQFLVGATTELAKASNADVNIDGVIDSRDALVLQQLEFGLIDSLPPPSISGEPAGGTPLPSTTLRVSSTVAPVGSKGTVVVEILNMPPPGLGAWGFNVAYDPTIATAQSCSGQNGSVCNPFFDADGVGPDAVRLVGASASGNEGDVKLGSFTFQCIALGSTSLVIVDRNGNKGFDTLADATVGAPQPIKPLLQHGSLTCGPPVPPEINITNLGQYALPKTCFDVLTDAQAPLFAVCDNDFQGTPTQNAVCEADGTPECEDADPSDGFVRVAVDPGDYHVVESKAPPNHVADPAKLQCAVVGNDKCELTFVNTPGTQPWFPWDVTGAGGNPDGAVTVGDIFEVAGHFGDTKP